MLGEWETGTVVRTRSAWLVGDRYCCENGLNCCKVRDVDDYHNDINIINCKSHTRSVV